MTEQEQQMMMQQEQQGVPSQEEQMMMQQQMQNPNEAPQQNAGQGQGQEMQKIQEFVEKAIAENMEPLEVAQLLLSKQVPPELIMQVFVSIGLSEEDSQVVIEQAMESISQQQVDPNQQQVDPNQQPMPPQEPMPPQGQMGKGGSMYYANQGGNNNEYSIVMQEISQMMKTSSLEEVMEYIQTSIQNGSITPETGTTILSDLQNQDTAMTENTPMSQEEMMMEQQMREQQKQQALASFGGHLKKLLNKSFAAGGNVTTENPDLYINNRNDNFLSSVRNVFNTSVLGESIDNNFKAYGGPIRNNNLPVRFNKNYDDYYEEKENGGLIKAEDGIYLKEGKVVVNPAAYPTEDAYDLALYRWNQDEKNTVKVDMSKKQKWVAAPKKISTDANARYKVVNGEYVVDNGTAVGGYTQEQWDQLQPELRTSVSNQQKINDQMLKQYQELMKTNGSLPVNYQDVGSLESAPNWMKILFPNFAQSYDVNNVKSRYNIRGENLPKGFDLSNDFAKTKAGVTPDGQTWRVTASTDFNRKEGSFWKGNRKKERGVRYDIEWGPLPEGAKELTEKEKSEVLKKETTNLKEDEKTNEALNFNDIGREIENKNFQRALESGNTAEVQRIMNNMSKRTANFGKDLKTKNVFTDYKPSYQTSFMGNNTLTDFETRLKEQVVQPTGQGPYLNGYTDPILNQYGPQNMPEGYVNPATDWNQPIPKGFYRQTSPGRGVDSRGSLVTDPNYNFASTNPLVSTNPLASPTYQDPNTTYESGYPYSNISYEHPFEENGYHDINPRLVEYSQDPNIPAPYAEMPFAFDNVQPSQQRVLDFQEIMKNRMKNKTYSYGGNIYEEGGEYDLTPEDLSALTEAGLYFEKNT